MNPAAAFTMLGALAGILGVLLSALARHRSGTVHLETAGQFLLLHAPALLALAALTGTGLVGARTGGLAGATLALGLGLFCGDLASREFLGRALFPMAAPTGGVLLMGGWLLVAVAALLRGA
jgi:uncharacterized membrane protein YgdD (TMEM256/DUF423 family)